MGFAFSPAIKNALNQILSHVPGLPFGDILENELNQLSLSTGGLTPSVDIWLDSNRSDSYTPDGTIAKPFKKLSDAIVGINSAFVLHMAPGNYSESGDVDLPDHPMTIYGNKSTLTISGTITVNNAHSIYDLNTVGTIVYAYTGTERSVRYGGSINGNVTIRGGFPHFDSLNYTGSMTITGGTPYFRGITGGGSITVNGASAVLNINDANMNKSNVSSANIIVTAGQLICKGGLFVNKGDTANIVFNNTNIVTAAHDLTQIVCNYGVVCNNAYTIVAPDCVIPILTGTAILSPLSIPIMGIGGGTAQAQTAAIPVPSTTVPTGYRFAYLVSVSNTGAGPTLAVNGGSAAAVIKASGAALAAADLKIGMIADMIWDGTNFRLMNPAGV